MAEHARGRDDWGVGGWGPADEGDAPLWLPGFNPPPRRRPPRYRPSTGATALVIVVAVATIAAGSVVALVGVGEPSGHHAGAAHRSAAHGSPPGDVIPAAPPTSAAPSPSSTVAPSGGGGGGGGAPSPSRYQVTYGRQVVAPVPLNSGVVAPITDPSVVATVQVPSLPLSPSPGAPAVKSLANPNYLGAIVVLLVTGIQADWVQAYIPIRPNETTAWFPASDVTLSFAPCHIAIGIGAHKLVLYCGNTQVFTAPVATGAPDSPTPTGTYFVAYIVKLTDPGDAYGPYALGTSAFSNTYFSFEGGPGQVGIHGTNQPWVIGSYASHGCVRLNNGDITALAQQIVPGTPVVIAG